MIRFFLLSLLFLITTTTYAAHVFSAKLSYRCLGNSQYVVTIQTYHECDGLGFPTGLTLEASSQSCAIAPISFTLPLIANESGGMVTLFCNAVAGQAACNGGNLPSENIAVYRDTITLPFECPDWKLFSEPALRSSYFTNLVNPAGANIYVEAVLDNSFGACYDSPVFRNHSMIYTCAGVPYTYDMGAYDWEADTLVYTLLAPLAGSSTFASFQPGFSLTKPLALQTGTSMTLNNRTGELTFTPQAGQNQFAALTIRVDKYHAGKIVASSMVEMDIQSSSFCTNGGIEQLKTTSNSPTYIYNDTLKGFFACANTTDTLQFSTTAHDLAGDALVMHGPSSSIDTIFSTNDYDWTVTPINSQNDSVSSAVWIVNPLATINAGGLYPFFTTTVEDNTCPFLSRRILHYAMYEHYVKAASSQQIVCADKPATIQLTMTASATYTNLQWTPIANGNPTITLSDATIPNPILSLPSLAGNTTLAYELAATVNGCMVRDTIEIQVVPNPTIQATVYNATTSTDMDGAIQTNVTGNLAQFDYAWSNGETADSIGGIGVGTYLVTVTDFYGCETTDTLNVSFGNSINTINNDNWTIQISPNPTVDKIINWYSNASHAATTVMIYNALGMLIENKKLSNVVKSQKQVISLGQHPAGVYFIRINTSKGEITKKIILD